MAIQEHQVQGAHRRSASAGRDVRQILDVVAGKWAILILEQLGVRTLRFSELQRAVPGVSPRMLTRTLRQLERDGMIKRTLQAGVPPRTDYQLTELGTTALGPVRALSDWARAYCDAILVNQASYDEQPR